MHREGTDGLGIACGAVAGLVTVTPASGFIGPFAAIVIGLAAGTACYAAIVWKGWIGYDDWLDVVGIHGVGGVIGIGRPGSLRARR